MSKRLKIELEADEHGERTTLTVTYDGVPLAEHWDCGEPEDNSFGRDWSWVPDLIEQVYEIGLAEGRGAPGEVTR